MSANPEEKTKILLVDDDESIRVLYARALTAAGFQVDTASNGREAIESLAQSEPAVIILDLVMPEQEGIETILQLHAQHPKIPVIAISGALGANEYLHVANLLGVRGTLTKPIQPEQLVKAVHSLLEQRFSAGT
jgi:DNA-binding response OmpR family regulator